MRSFEALLTVVLLGEVCKPPDEKITTLSNYTDTERVLLEIIDQCVNNDDERTFCSHIKGLCRETQLSKKEVRKILATLRGQLIIDLVSTSFEDGGYAGRGYTIRHLNMYTAAEFKRSLNIFY